MSQRITNPYIEKVNSTDTPFPKSGPISKTPTLKSLTRIDLDEAIVKQVVKDAKANKVSGIYMRVAIPRDE